MYIMYLFYFIFSLSLFLVLFFIYIYFRVSFYDAIYTSNTYVLVSQTACKMLCLSCGLQWFVSGEKGDVQS